MDACFTWLLLARAFVLGSIESSRTVEQAALNSVTAREVGEKVSSETSKAQAGGHESGVTADAETPYLGLGAYFTFF
jgi:hypothetical protein